MLLTVHAQPRIQPLLLTVLWMDLVGLGCRERTEWLLARPASADSGAEEAEGEVAPFFFQLNLLVVLETMPLTFSSE
jgi:hypothetical protein